MLDVLTPIGFVQAELDAVPLHEQIDLFRSARRVVAAHGAALANLVHLIGRHARLVELIPGDVDFLRRVDGPWLTREAGFAHRAVAGSRLSGDGGFEVSTVELHAAASAVLRELDGAS